MSYCKTCMTTKCTYKSSTVPINANKCIDLAGHATDGVVKSICSVHCQSKRQRKLNKCRVTLLESLVKFRSIINITVSFYEYYFFLPNIHNSRFAAQKVNFKTEFVFDNHIKTRRSGDKTQCELHLNVLIWMRNCTIVVLNDTFDNQGEICTRVRKWADFSRLISICFLEDQVLIRKILQ